MLTSPVECSSKAPWRHTAERAHLGSLRAVGYGGLAEAGDVHDLHRHDAHQTSPEERGPSEAWAMFFFFNWTIVFGGLCDGL